MGSSSGDKKREGSVVCFVFLGPGSSFHSQLGYYGEQPDTLMYEGDTATAGGLLPYSFGESCLNILYSW